MTLLFNDMCNASAIEKHFVLHWTWFPMLGQVTVGQMEILMCGFIKD